MTRFGCHFETVHIRNGRVLSSQRTHNNVVREGMEHFAGILFLGTTPATDWKVGLIDLDSFIELSVDDTLGSHVGWVEYTEVVRQTWPKSELFARSSYWSTYWYVTNLTGEYATFTFPSDANIRGAFLTNGSLILCTTSLTTVEVLKDDELQIRYTIYCYY